MRGNSIKLISFVALSMVAHGLMFLIQTDSGLDSAPPSIGTRWLSVSLSASNNETKQNPAQSNVSLSHNQQQQKIESVSVPNKPQITKPPVVENKIVQPTTTAENTAQRNFLLGEIQHRLSRYLSYPISARRRGWEGEVKVGFFVDKQGYLHNVHLAQTSGYSLLDSAALTAIEKVKNIPLSLWGKKWSSHWDEDFNPIALQLPVIYRLTNS